MKVCEICGGRGYHTIAGGEPHGLGTHRLLCASCEGTGAILLGLEGADRYAQKRVEARQRAAAEGWLEDTWIEGRAVRRVIAVEQEVG